MPFVMKQPHGRSKGIVVLTHKERLVIGDVPLGQLGRALSGLRERYVVGMHWGHYYADVEPPEWVDFHLAGHGTVTFRHPERVRHIPLASRNFIGSEFRDLGLPRVWDIVNIARPVTIKRLDEFLAVVRRIYDTGTRLRVLLLCPCPERMTERDGWYTRLYDDYAHLFTPDERGDFVLLLLRGDGYPFPLASGAVARLLNTAKTFAFFSEEEGEARVVAEALLCGAVVVCRRDVRGGAADYLGESNSRLFTTLDEARDGFLDVAAGWDETRSDVRTLEPELREEHTAGRLVGALRDVFADLGVPFEGEVDLTNLARKLPSHELSLPPDLRAAHTNDLRSERAAIVWIQALLGRPAWGTDLWRLRRESLARNARNAGSALAWRLLRRARSVLRHSARTTDVESKPD